MLICFEIFKIDYFCSDQILSIILFKVMLLFKFWECKHVWTSSILRNLQSRPAPEVADLPTKPCMLNKFPRCSLPPPTWASNSTLRILERDVWRPWKSAKVPKAHLKESLKDCSFSKVSPLPLPLAISSQYLCTML